MGKQTFEVDVTTTVILELDDAVIEVVDDEWRKTLYNLRTPLEIAKHIAYNMVVNDASLSRLDGWADQPDGNARIVQRDCDVSASIASITLSE